MENPRVTVCVATVRADSLPFTVESLARQRFRDFDVVVVGQGADEQLRVVGDRISREHGNLTYLSLAERGLSRARNAALRAAHGELIAFIDDDCEAHEDWLLHLVSAFDDDPTLGLVGGAVDQPIGSIGRFCTCPAVNPVEVTYDPKASGRRPPEGFGWIGANFAVRRAVFDDIGPFDEFLGAGTDFPAAEEVDVMLRMERLGVRMRSTPQARVTHTFGTRCGLKNRFRHSRNYARGNGALGAKLTLSGDARGNEWRQITKRAWYEALRSGRLLAVPGRLVRYRFFMGGYRTCLGTLTIDASGQVLIESGASITA